MTTTSIKKRPHAIYDFGESRTQQQFRKSADIGTIVNNLAKGILPIGNKSEAKFVDAYDVSSYHESLNIVTKTKQTFEQLSKHVRNRFQNNPAKMLEFLNNPENMEEAIKLGLATPTEKPKETISKVEVVNPTSAPKEGDKPAKS